MKFLEQIREIALYLFDIVKEILLGIVELLLQLIEKCWYWMRSKNPGEQLILANFILAFIAIMAPAAKFFIFARYNTVNNPLGVYLILIVIFMFVTIYFHGKIKLISRIILNAYYWIWAIYLPVAGKLTLARPYDITFLYYLNWIVPLVFIGGALVSYLQYHE